MQTIVYFGIAWLLAAKVLANAQRSELSRMGFPPDLYDYQRQLDSLTIDHNQLDSIAWLRGSMSRLALRGSLTSFRDVENIPSSVKQLDLSFNQFTEWSGLNKLPASVSELTLEYPHDPHSESGGTERSPPANPDEDPAPAKAELHPFTGLAYLPAQVKKLTLTSTRAGEEAGDIGQIAPSVETLVLRGSCKKIPGLGSRLPASLRKLIVDEQSQIFAGAFPQHVQVIAMPLRDIAAAGFDFSGEPLATAIYSANEAQQAPRSRLEECRQAGALLKLRAEDLPVNWERLKVSPAGILFERGLRAEALAECIKTLPPTVKRIVLMGFGKEWEGKLEAFLAVPASVSSLYFLGRLGNDSLILDKLPATVTSLMMDAQGSNAGSLDSMTRRVTCLRNIRGSSDELKAFFSRHPHLEELKMDMPDHFVDLEFLQPLKKLKALDFRFGTGSLASSSLKGLPPTVKTLEMHLHLGP